MVVNRRLFQKADTLSFVVQWYPVFVVYVCVYVESHGVLFGLIVAVPWKYHKTSWRPSIEIHYKGEHFKHQHSCLSQIFELMVSTSERVLKTINVVVWIQVKQENYSLPAAICSSKA